MLPFSPIVTVDILGRSGGEPLRSRCHSWRGRRGMVESGPTQRVVLGVIPYFYERSTDLHHARMGDFASSNGSQLLVA